MVVLNVEKRLSAYSEDASLVTATFTLTATNDGPSAATGIVVTDLLDDNAPLVSVFFSDESHTYNAATCEWTIGTLAVGEVATMTMTITAEIAGNQPDQSAHNNLAGVVIGRNIPDPARFRSDLSLTKTVNNTSPTVGDEVVYTLTVSNGGPFTTAGSEVTYLLPSGVNFVSATTSSESAGSVPTAYALYGNYPNPFNPQTTIPYGVPDAGVVRVAIYDLIGREIAVLVEGTVAAGRYEVVWEAKNQPTGLYLVQLEAEGHSVTRRITLMQ